MDTLGPIWSVIGVCPLSARLPGVLGTQDFIRLYCLSKMVC